ncbi:MAG: hypothetical protein WAO12_03635 [Venatoribacter sp.]
MRLTYLTPKWLIMLALTLVVALNPANSQGAVFLYGLIWGVTLLKGWWIIQDFMELRHAPAFLGRILQGWLLITTSAVTLAAVWQ